jgi:hypothetical protein
MFRKLVATALILSFSAFAQSAANAQEREYQSGINSVKLYNAPKVATPTEPERPAVKSIQEHTRSGQAPKHGQDLTKQSPTERVWSKYKELASGENNGKPSEDKPAVPAPEVQKPEVQKIEPQAPQGAVPEEKTTGLQSLLKAYQTNKDQQRQMRTKTLKTPKNLPTNDTLPSNPQ